MFARKRSPDSSSAEPPRKFQSWAPRSRNYSNEGPAPWNSNRPTNDNYRSERNFSRNDFQRGPSSLEARINPFARQPPAEVEEDLAPPGTESSTLQHTLTPRVSFLTWKDRLYRELEELNCLFTIDLTTRKKANMTLEEEFTYRNLAKAIISMRLDEAHLALVRNANDPLKMMKVLADFREPEKRHLEQRAQQRLNATVYRASVPVGDFVRTFENLLKEVEMHSGERMSDNTMKQHLLSAIIGDFPDIMVGSKVSSSEIRYEDLKKLLIAAVERRAAAKNAELEQQRAAAAKDAELEQKSAAAAKSAELAQRRAAARNAELEEKRATAAKSAELAQRRAAARNAELEQQRAAAAKNAELEQRRIAARNAELEQQRAAAAKNAELEQRRIAARNAELEQQRAAARNAELEQRRIASRNVQVSAKQPAGKNEEVKAQHPVARTSQGNEQRTTGTNAAVSQNLESCIGTSKIVEVSNRRPVTLNAGVKVSEVKEQHPTASNVANNSAAVKKQQPVAENQSPAVKNSNANQQNAIASSSAAERPQAVQEAKETERPSNTKSVRDERPFPPDAQSNERRSVARSDADERPLPVRDNSQRPVVRSNMDERPFPVRDNSQRPVIRSNVDERPFPVKDNSQRPVARSDTDERPHSVADSRSNEQQSSANSDMDDWPNAVRDAIENDWRAASRSAVGDRPLPARDGKTNELRPVGTNVASGNVDKEDPRPIGASANVDGQRGAVKNTEVNERRLATSDTAGERRMSKQYGADANAAGKNCALYERRPPKPTPKDELEEQLELDRQIQEQINSNSRAASKEISCTRCGAFGHLVGDCKRKDNLRKCYSCLQFVDDHVASTCPYWNECAAMPKSGPARAGTKFTPASRESKKPPQPLPPSPPPFGHPRHSADKRWFPEPTEIVEDDDEEEDEDEDDIPLVEGLRQVYHIRRKMTTKKLKTGRTARKDLIFTDSDFYTDVEYREMFIEEDEEEPGDIILETIKVMSTGQK